ncbi:hypothetical protein [Gimesia panareensis]|uniref:hypothetical protein n=1 Tax=Gimesia panareensis TaxID=2527978 RepID=UPI0011A6A4A4|nr:hypothetical protein [Gimesia panareensis]
MVSYCEDTKGDFSKNKILPDKWFQSELKAYFKKTCKCRPCTININACGKKGDPKVKIELQKIADSTGCKVCGTTRTIAFGRLDGIENNRDWLTDGTIMCVKPAM